MKRRDLIKAGIIAASAAALSGCSKKPEITTASDTLEITPKQTGIYKMSAPIPYDCETIDGFLKLNQKYKKSQFVTLYNNIQRPYITSFNEWLQVGDGSTPSVRNFEEFAVFARHALSSGLEVSYLLNSPKPYTIKDFNSFKSDLYRLLENLANIGINNIKVGNTQTAELVLEFNPNFKLSSSTAFEFHDVSQYINLLKSYPQINLIDIAIDENQNFGFLANLRKLFPDVAIEVMVNEPCIKGCPARSSHVSSVTYSVFDCFKLRNARPMYYAMKSPGIYPWNVEYYSAIGINNFKFVIGKGGRGEYRELNNLDRYMEIIEYGYENYTARELFDEVIRAANVQIPPDLKVSRIMQYLPDIRHFVKQGDKCASSCGSECKYCEIMAERLDGFLKSLNG